MTSASTSGATDTSIVFDPDTYVDRVPHDALARLRRDRPVVWVEEPPVGSWPGGPGFWAVLRHADVKTVMRQPRVFSSWLGATQIRDPERPEDLDYVRQSMLNMDPPEHTRLRQMVSGSFTVRAVQRLEERITKRARDLVAAVAERGECDFATDIAADLPVSTLADVLGVPESDRWLLYDWSNRVIGYQDTEYAVSDRFDREAATSMARAALAERPTVGPDGRMPDPRTREGIADLYAYAHELAAVKRRQPGEDIMSILLAQVDDEGGRISVAEFENMFWLLAVAGNETLRNGLPGGMVALLEHPDEYARLRADRALLPTATREMLRWWTPVMNFRRTATRDVALGGVDISAGDKVVVYFASANRDDSVFDDPDRFDVSRTPGDDLVFGYGPHFCLGSHLAACQMNALFDAVLDQLGQVQLAGPVERLRSNFQNGVKHLPVRWTPGGSSH